MAVTDDRKYTKEFVYKLLEGVKGKTLGEVDSSHQFLRTEKSQKITGIAGDVIEQSVFKYKKDSDQECDIEIDGVLTELKTTGVRIPKKDIKNAKGKKSDEYKSYYAAKEGISITRMTFEPNIQLDFNTSHFWEKSKRLLIVFYEYQSYDVVPASNYADFPIVDYCYNSFSDEEKAKLKSDWDIVRDYLKKIYDTYESFDERYKHLVGFTHILRSQLLLIELVPGFKDLGEDKKTGKEKYQRPRYRLKQTFVNYIVRGHFNKTRVDNEISLNETFSSFAQLDTRCHKIAARYKGKTISELKDIFHIKTVSKDIAAKCVLRMFNANCKKLNQISDFNKAGIIIKTVTVTPTGSRTEDMKLKHIDFEEWADRDVDFEDSTLYNYFCEHSFLCPVFCERGDMSPHKKNETKEAYEKRIKRESMRTTFEGFKRFSFDDTFINNEVKRTWNDSRKLIHRNELVWEYTYDKNGKPVKNSSGSYSGAPNFPKSSDYDVFFRGGGTVSNEQTRTECVNGIRMLPQFLWLKGTYITDKLKSLPYI